jgi:hypothetical protein
MMQTKTRAPCGPSLAARIDPIGAMAGFATVFVETPEARRPGEDMHCPSQPLFVPPCRYEPLVPLAGQSPAANAETASKGDSAPRSIPRQRGWIARCFVTGWSWYRDRQERQLINAAWETLDERTLRDIGVSRDAIGGLGRLASYWERCDTVL